MKEVGQKLKQYFDSKGITQRQIAEILQLDPGYINGLFAGRRNFGKKQAQVWHDKFGLSPSWLITGEGEMFVTDDQQESDARASIVVQELREENQKLKDELIEERHRCLEQQDVINKLVQRNLLLQEKLDKYVDYEAIKQKVEELADLNAKIYLELLSSKKVGSEKAI